MLVKTCLECKFHKLRNEEEGRSSYCGKEGCWAVYTNCVTQKAVERFLIEECRMNEGPLKLNSATR